MGRKRIPTSRLNKCILGRIFKEYNAKQIAVQLIMKHNNSIPFDAIRKYRSTYVFVVLRQRGFVPYHTLNKMIKI